MRAGLYVALVGLALLATSATGQSACVSNGGISQPAGTGCAWQGEALFNGTVLVNGTNNLQGNVQACCNSCQNSSMPATGLPCNTWTWCGNPKGCCASRTGCNASSTLVPYLACSLLFEEALEYADESPKPTYVYNATDVAGWAAGTNTSALTSGVYLDTIIEAEQIAGYTVLQSQDVTGDDYVCPGSDFIGLDVGGCRLNGTAAELTAGCSADPKCTAVTHQPYGCCSSSESNALYESGWRKTGAINPSCTTFLPHTSVYIKNPTASS